MAEIFSAKAKFTWVLSDLKNQVVNTPDVQRKINSLQIAPWEDALLYQVFPPNQTGSIDVDEYLHTLVVLRGNDPNDVLVPLPVDKLEDFNFSRTSFPDPDFQTSLLKSLYVILKEGDNNQAILLMRRLEEDAISKFSDLKKDVPDEMLALYKRVYIILLVNFFYLLPDDIQINFFSTDLAVEAMRLGFNLHEVVRRFVDEYSDFKNRQEACLNFSGALAVNDTVVGQNNQGQPASVRYWLDYFRTMSKSKFSGMDLVNFLNDKNYTGRLSGEDVEIVRQLLELYVHLVNGFLMLPPGSLELINPLVNQLASVPEITLQEAENVINPKMEWAELLSVPLSNEQLNSLKSWIEAEDPQEVKELFKKEFSVMDWKSEPFLSNLLLISEIFENIFGETVGPLIYFDESANKFVWNE